MDNIDRITAAFAALRKQGFIARQHFSCCSSCASYELCEKVSEMPAAKRAKVKGVVFTTRQDRGARTLYIKHGPLETTKWGTIGLSEQEVGQHLFDALIAQGLDPQWDGNPRNCIEVRL